jgi:hypothetical protein
MGTPKGANTMFNFIGCPFCAGHETVSPLAASIIRESIALH